MSPPVSSDLFMLRTAVISPCGLFRYELRRVWDDSLPLLVVCMLNPSTADAEKDDPTLRELIHFARLWGYGGLLVVNLFALRTSSPSEMMASSDQFGPENARYLMSAQEYAREHGGRILAAWGNHGDFNDRAEWFCSRSYHVYGVDLICLGTTKSWHPKHPMARGKHRIPRGQQPILWRAAA